MSSFAWTRFCNATAANVAAACTYSGFMSALLVAVGNGLEATSIAQGAAGTFSSLLACCRLHAGSVFLGGSARNVLFLEIRT